MTSPLARRLAAELANGFVGDVVHRLELEYCELERRARDVADAVTRLEQMKHTRAEIGARKSLEARAAALRKTLRDKDEMS